MTNKISFITLILLSAFLACRKKDVSVVTPIFNPKNLHIGDSVILNNLLTKIVFTDSSVIIDSIVYTRYSNSSNSIKAVNTYLNGKEVFENIEYYEDGTVRVYQFIDEDSANFFYKKEYDRNGVLTSTMGTPFFQVYVDKIDPNTSTVKKGTTIPLRVFYPNPLDSKTFLFVRFTGNQKIDVFHQDNAIRFSKYVFVDNDNYDSTKNWREIEIGLEIRDEKIGRLDTYNKSLFYQMAE